MNVFLKFGSRESELERVQAVIADALNLKFDARESSYWGGDYFLARLDGGIAKSIKVHLNVDVYSNEPIFPEFAEYRVLIHCDHVAEEDLLISALRELGLEPIDRSSI